MGKSFKWDLLSDQAADLLACGYTQKEVADFVKKDTRTIRNWAANAEFQDKVAECRAKRAAKFRDELIDGSLRTLDQRLAVIEQTTTDLLKVKAARAIDEHAPQLPGGDTGLLKSKTKTVVPEQGDEYTEVSVEIDKDLTGEIRANVLAAHKMVIDVEGGEGGGEKTLPTVFVID